MNLMLLEGMPANAIEKLKLLRSQEPRVRLRAGSIEHHNK
jgi:hypothetical protein